jgi:hypothetical protein
VPVVIQVFTMLLTIVVWIVVLLPVDWLACMLIWQPFAVRFAVRVVLTVFFKVHIAHPVRLISSFTTILAFLPVQLATIQIVLQSAILANILVKIA